MSEGQDVLQLLKLTLVISQKEASPHSLMDLAEAAFDGGVTALQLREKNMSDCDFLGQALLLRHYCRERKRLFIVNNRLDLAMATMADGLHLGQSDLPVEVAAHLWPGHIIGVSVNNLRQARSAAAGKACYLALGSMFPTDSKGDAKLVDPEETKAIIALGAPTVAIGGITTSNAGELWSQGFTGLAVISAVAAAENPEEAARQLLVGSEKK